MRRVRLTRRGLFVTRLRLVVGRHGRWLVGVAAVLSVVAQASSAAVASISMGLGWAFFGFALAATILLGLVAYLSVFDAEDAETRRKLDGLNQDSRDDLLREILGRIEAIEARLGTIEERLDRLEERVELLERNSG